MYLPSLCEREESPAQKLREKLVTLAEPTNRPLESGNVGAWMGMGWAQMPVLQVCWNLQRKLLLTDAKGFCQRPQLSCQGCLS